MISLSLNASTEALRREFLRWLKANPPPIIDGRIELDRFVEISRIWQGRLAKERWVGVHWPEQYGGRGLSLVDEAIIQESLAEAGSPQLVNLFGLTMVGPVLIEHGSDEQKTRFLPRILSAEEIWCQGFSEPDAGSDLASVRTKGERIELDGVNCWSISGQKVWTSFAQAAAWCFLLAKTEPEAERYDSLSYILVPMEAAGITVRPLTQISGDREFNELFLEQVVVPLTNTVGKPGEGWKIAISTLMYERVVLTFARHLQSEQQLQEIRKLFSTGRAKGSASVREFGELIAKNMGVRALALSHLLEYSVGDGIKATPGPEGSLDKLGWSENFQDICRFAMGLLGPSMIATEGPESYDGGALQHQYLYSRGRSIAAGTSEIQRNIISERVLGLPRQGR